MADDDLDLDDVELLDVEEDNARDLTSGLVIGSFVVGLLALFLIFKAMGKWYAAGPLA